MTAATQTAPPAGTIALREITAALLDVCDSVGVAPSSMTVQIFDGRPYGADVWVDSVAAMEAVAVALDLPEATSVQPGAVLRKNHPIGVPYALAATVTLGGHRLATVNVFTDRPGVKR